MKQISFGREVTSHLENALKREWLVTNGIGGYASSTVVGTNTRRYHGLLVAALQPPLERTLLVSKLEATARLGGDLFALTTNEYTDGTISPHGYHNLECFELEGTIPCFTWAVADALIEQRIWMAHGQNTTYVTYTLVRATQPIALEIVPLCTFRRTDETTDIRGWMPQAHSVKGGLRINPLSGQPPYWLWANRGIFVPGVVRHWSIRHRAESYYGRDDREDLFAVGRLDTKLVEGETLALVLTTEREPALDWEAALEAEKARQAQLLAQAGLESEPGWVHQLVLAADQFLVDRPIPSGGKATAGAESRGKTVIAGYPWFGDWGRDTMIGLPGLTLATGRPEIAASILRTFARFVDQGMLPSRFLDGADGGKEPEFQAADATLWFFHALYQYLRRTDDLALVRELYPILEEMISWHTQGTRHDIVVDERDGLLRVGEAEIGLTWMNAPVDDRVVTPRVGKPVEINALWHNALGTMAHFAAQLGREAEADRWRDMAERTAERFAARFWYDGERYLYDVIDGPEGDDATLRPNQVLAVSLPYAPLKDGEKARAVVDTVARYLQTSYGLRTLSPRADKYHHRYGGDRAARHEAYHQGTVWGWLIGPFVMAHQKVYGDVAKARSFLRPFADHLVDHGVGSISEIFDGGPPHAPRGCIASAWSVAELLCGWLACGA